MFKSRPVALFVWMLASIFYAYQYILRVMPSIMLGDIMRQFHIDATIFGQFSGIYYIGYSAMHLPIGIMLDRYGPRRVMTGCILSTVIGLLPLLFSDHWIYPVLGRALIGMGSSAAILGTFKITRMTFTEQRFARMLSLSVTIGLIGAIYGGAPVSALCNTLGYRVVIEIFAVMGLLLALATYWIIPTMDSTDRGDVMADIKTVLTNKRVLSTCFFAGMMVGPLEGFADVWGKSFLKEVYSFNGTLAASLPSMIFIGMCFGGPLLSLIAERTKRYLGTIIAAGALMLLSFLMLLTEQLSATTISLLFLLVGICCAYQILVIYKASTYVPSRAAGLTTAVANMIIMSFGYAFHSLIGITVDAAGGPTVAKALIDGVAIIPAALSLGILGFLILVFSTKPEAA